MTPSSEEQPRPRPDAEKLLARRRRRTGLIRKRAIAGTVVAFGAAWGVIGYQLVSGHDPALGKNSGAAVVAPSANGESKKSAGASATPSTSTDSPSSGSTSTGSGSTGSASAGSSSTGSSSSSSSQQPAPVTTRQS